MLRKNALFIRHAYNNFMGLPIKEFQFQFSRSSGPGGQKVNKTATKATLNWDIENTTFFNKAHKERFLKGQKNKINEEGIFQLTSQKFSNRSQNIADCIQKLSALVEKYRTPPKKRKPTKPTKSSVEKRLEKKRGKSQIKKNRKKFTDF